MLYPGMTEWETFYIPFSAQHTSNAIVTYSQNDIALIQKSTDGFTAVDEENSFFEIFLSQTDTLRLGNNCKTIIQINVLTDDGERYTSEPIQITTGTQSYRAVMM